MQGSNFYKKTQGTINYLKLKGLCIKKHAECKQIQMQMTPVPGRYTKDRTGQKEQPLTQCPGPGARHARGSLAAYRKAERAPEACDSTPGHTHARGLSGALAAAPPLLWPCPRDETLCACRERGRCVHRQGRTPRRCRCEDQTDTLRSGAHARPQVQLHAHLQGHLPAAPCPGAALAG